MDEKTELKKLKKKFEDAFKEIIVIAKTKIDGKALDIFNDNIKKLPPGQVIINRIEELRSSCTNTLKELIRLRKDQFRRVIAGFVNEMRNRDIYVKQTSEGWRIDKFEYRIRDDSAKVAVHYNGERMLPWATVSSDDDIKKLRQDAENELKKYTIDSSDLVYAIDDGFKEAKNRIKQRNLTNQRDVDIIDFIKEFRLSLVRKQIYEKYDKNLKYSSLPKWAILYNLDRYRINMSKIPENKRYRLSVPSQKASIEGKAILLGGLSARDYEYFSRIGEPVDR